MKLLKQDGPWALYQCDCGCEFAVDATTEDNLKRVTEDGHVVLAAKCPKCGRVEE